MSALWSKIGRIRAGLAAVDSKMPLAEAARRWRTTTLIASDRRQSTKDLYTSRCRLHIEIGPLAGIRMARLVPSHVEEWIIDSLQHGIAPSSLRTDYAVLRAVLETAVRDGIVAKNVAAQVPRPRVPQHEALYLTPEQVSSLLLKVAPSRHWLSILLAAVTGMRRGEVLAMRWCDIDFDARTLTVAGTMIGSGKTLRRESSAKTDASHRILPIGQKLVSLLMLRRAEQARDRRLALGNWRDAGVGFVFTDEYGSSVEPRNMLRTLQNAAQELGLPKGTCIHTLRHSAATALLAGGAHLRLVSAILGHSNTSITADIYGHAPDTAQRAALDALHNLLTSELRGNELNSPYSDVAKLNENLSGSQHAIDASVG
ncbi:MAG: tyrosine-type recombinase/integrase, partial [Mycobacterium sp.]